MNSTSITINLVLFMNDLNKILFNNIINKMRIFLIVVLTSQNSNRGRSVKP